MAVNRLSPVQVQAEVRCSREAGAKVISKISVPVTKRKGFSLNLNEYRNAHFRVLDQAKKTYTSDILPELKKLKPMKQVEIHYVLYKGSHHKVDVANICSIVDKFFSDALVKAGVLEDDNHEIVKSVTYSYGGYSKEDPRVEIFIYPLRGKNHGTESEPK